MSSKALEKHLEPLQKFLDTQNVTEICINKPQEVWVEKDSVFKHYQADELTIDFLGALAALVAEYNNKDFPTPLIAGQLLNGERVQFVMSPACEQDTIVCSIRRHQMKDMALNDYEKQGAFKNIVGINRNMYTRVDDQLMVFYNNGDIASFLRLAVEARKNIIISGGTGTGKTTFLNACLKFIPDSERLITVEDTREVSIRQPNVVHLLFNEDDEQITALKIFKTCLRLRPDRVFLSELRGHEAWSFLRATNSGHPGSLSTVHADTPQACFEQIIFMMQQAGSTSSDMQIRNYVKSIINIVVQLKRDPNPDRFMYVSDIYFDAIERGKCK